MAENTGKEVQRIRKPSEPKTTWAEMGKIPPQAIETEEAILGALLLEKDAIYVISGWFPIDAFYRDEHKEIYTAILSVHLKKQPIDLITVTNELRSTGRLEYAGGPFRVSELSNQVGSAANLEWHALIVAQKYLLRNLISVGTDIVTDAYDDTTDVFELIGDIQRKIAEISKFRSGARVKDTKTLIQDLKDNIKATKADPSKGSGVPTGFIDLDKVIGSWQKTYLIIVAGRPGMGKSAFVLSTARHAALRYGAPVAIYSLEMSSLHLTARLVSPDLKIPAEQIIKGELTDAEEANMDSQLVKLADAPIFIDDTSALNIFELGSSLRKLKREKNISMAIIDYLQLMSGMNMQKGKQNKNDNREQEISTISRQLKELAKELDIPIIALSQLSRAVEQRGGKKKPVLSDLRESGSIEQDADQVIFVYRPEYYGFDKDSDGGDSPGVAEIIIEKNRNGKVHKTVKLFFNGPYMLFQDWDISRQDNYISSGQHEVRKYNNVEGSGEWKDDELPF